MRRLLGTVTEGGQRKTTLRALSISGRTILEEQEGRRAIRIDASFCLNYYRSLPPFSLSISIHFSLSFSLHSSFFYRHCSRFHKHPRSRSYTIFLNSRESSSVSAIYARNFIVDFSFSLSLKYNFARPRGKNNVIYSPAPVELPT